MYIYLVYNKRFENESLYDDYWAILDNIYADPLWDVVFSYNYWL